MKPKPNKQKPQLDYQERALVMQHAAAKAEIKEIIADYKAAKVHMGRMKDDCIKSANACRSVGIRLQALCQHEQITLDFWQKNCAEQLPFDFTAAKMFIAIARKLPQPAKTIEEAAPFTQMVFQAGNLLEAPTRDEAQNSISVDSFQVFLKEITIVRKDFAKSIRQMPMEQWSKDLLQSFLSETKWLAEERERAAKLKGVKP